MTEVVVLQQSPSSQYFPSSPSSSSSSSSINAHIAIAQEEEEEEEISIEETDQAEADQVPVLELLLSAFRRSLIGPCAVTEARNFPPSRMEISWPSNVRHIAHVTFDRFNGFLGLPVEFEPEVPRRPPSASASVFGVSTESMQLSFDSRGNSVPTILLMMQRRLYARGGLEAEGIFRINGENSQEEYVRDQLNGGVVPDNVDVHCLAGLIKAWFRELPTGVLDSISPEQVMQSQTEEECIRLVRLLPPTEAALLDWAVNLMADVAEFEHFNKMNARNVAMVFAPNMTQMVDPLTALMYAVQVMNFLKTLVAMTLEERRDSVPETSTRRLVGPSDEDDHENTSRTRNEEAEKDEVSDSGDNRGEPGFENSPRRSAEGESSFLSSIENIILKENDGLEPPRTTVQGKKVLYKAGKKGGILGRVNSGKELAEAWR